MADHELGLTRGDRVVVLAGGLLGWGLPIAARWLLSLPWVPFGGPAARAKALENKRAADADEPHKLGFTGRDVGAVQHWRPLVQS
ncbi:YqeB family protein [Dactylosporangium sp. CA-139114]|uniref:YqeB family protein n=1 Tax=Dactylosporangium sp. CA-139114 TaxID=3239931 RepID=UPI003D9895AB